MAEKQLLANQTAFLEKARTVRERMQKWAEEANACNMPILAREFDYLGKQLQGAISNQARAFRDEALGDTLAPSSSDEGRK